MTAILADVVLAVHFAFVLFVVVGQLLLAPAWAFDWQTFRNPTFRFGHLGAVAFVVIQSWLGVLCPLTLLEDHLRESSGTTGYEEMSFVGYWLHRLLYYEAEPWVFTLIYSLFGSLVVLTFLFYSPRFHRSKPS